MLTKSKVRGQGAPVFDRETKDLCRYPGQSELRDFCIKRSPTLNLRTFDMTVAADDESGDHIVKRTRPHSIIMSSTEMLGVVSFMDLPVKRY